MAFSAICGCLLLTLAAFGAAQQQQPAAVVLPATVIAAPPPMPPPVQPPGTFQAIPAPAPAPPTPPAQAAAPPTAAAAPLGQVPATECPPLDEFIKDKYDAFFLLSRLVDAYTLGENQPPVPAVNQSYSPLTVLVPASKTIDFLRANGLDIRGLAASPLESVLLAPTLAAHFVRGYFPASALPLAPVQTLCGSACGPLTFLNESPVRVEFTNNPSVNATIVRPNVAECPGMWVVHEIDRYLFTNVTDPVQAAEPALNLANALGGEWNTYNLLGKP